MIRFRYRHLKLRHRRYVLAVGEEWNRLQPFCNALQRRDLRGFFGQWSMQVRIASAKLGFSGTALEKLLDECAADPAIRSGQPHDRALDLHIDLRRT